MQLRPASVTLAQFMKPSHPSKPPPNPSFKAAPPPPPGPPPSASQAAVPSTAQSQGTAAPATEPRRNAWEQPLAGSSLPHLHADSFNSLSRKQSGALPTGTHEHERHESHGASSSGNADSHSALEDAGNRHQGDMAGTVSSSPTKMSIVVSCVTASAAAASVHYPREAQHKAQIADLQASQSINPVNLAMHASTCCLQGSMRFMCSAALAISLLMPSCATR